MTVKKKIIISISTFIIFVALIIYFIILPTIKEIKGISDAVYAERVDLEKKYLRGQLLRKTLEDFEKIRPQKERLSSVFIIEGKELEFITALEKITTLHNLIQDIRLQSLISDQERKNYYYPLPLEISVRGGFIRTIQYLKSLEELNYYFNISSINITASDQENLISTNLKGEIYALPMKEKEE